MQPAKAMQNMVYRIMVSLRQRYQYYYDLCQYYCYYDCYYYNYHLYYHYY